MIKVKIIEEERGHINPLRKYHIFSLSDNCEVVSNLKLKEVYHYVDLFNFKIVL